MESSDQLGDSKWKKPPAQGSNVHHHVSLDISVQLTQKPIPLWKAGFTLAKNHVKSIF